MPSRVELRQRWRTSYGATYTITGVGGSGPDGTATVVLDDGEQRGPWLQSQIMRDEYLGGGSLIYLRAAGGMFLDEDPDAPERFAVWAPTPDGAFDVLGAGPTATAALRDARRTLTADLATRRREAESKAEIRAAAAAVRAQLDILRREVDQMERDGKPGLEALKRWRTELQALLAYHFSM